jgi:hypothetical protein
MPKITELTAATEAATTDVLVLVQGVGGTPVTRKIEFQSLLDALLYTEVYIKVLDEGEDLAVGDGQRYFIVPEGIDGGIIVAANIAVYTPSSSGAPAVQIARYRSGSWVDIFSTKPTVNAGHYSTYTGGTVGIALNSGVVKGDVWRVDVDSIGTGTKGLDVIVKVKRL